jgi:hypothetical protein
VYEREAVFVYINVERIRSSVEVTEENAEKHSDGLEKPLKSDRQSAGNSIECCGTVQNGKNTCDETGGVGPAILLPSDSAANLTAQDSTVGTGIAAPVTRDEHHNTDGAKYSAEKWNASNPLHCPHCNRGHLDDACLALCVLVLLLFSLEIVLFVTLVVAERRGRKGLTPMHKVSA